MSDIKISSNRQKKMQLVDELSLKVGKAKGMVFTDYTGLTHQQIEGLKRAVKKLNAEFVVTKNTLLKRSLGELINHKSSIINPDSEAVFNQPTATLFAYADLVEPLKVLAKSIKDINLPLYKAGLLDGQMLSAQEVEKLSTLPAKSVLQAQLLGIMKSPIQNLHRALNWNMQSLVMTLHAIELKKS
ncbi:MAG TPA: 50S ribosomal protein L10 [Patescibacteria group bacterium]|nr:50S ribosomal protein L10 [Patescibacteria group bacterium]